MGEDVKDVTDSKPAADGGIEAEDKEEFLVPSTDAVSEEEAVMVENVNTSLAVGAVVRPEGDVEVTGKTFLVPATRDLVASKGSVVTSALYSPDFVDLSLCNNHHSCTKRTCSCKLSCEMC